MDTLTTEHVRRLGREERQLCHVTGDKRGQGRVVKGQVGEAGRNQVTQGPARPVNGVGTLS